MYIIIKDENVLMYILLLNLYKHFKCFYIVAVLDKVLYILSPFVTVQEDFLTFLLSRPMMLFFVYKVCFFVLSVSKCWKSIWLVFDWLNFISTLTKMWWIEKFQGFAVLPNSMCGTWQVLPQNIYWCNCQILPQTIYRCNLLQS